ncbi:MAG: SAM-dependent methyltransferase [Chloroflexi bacterium]|nr:SAM-dependent methyltransferase [Chloroflexota bacterium]
MDWIVPFSTLVVQVGLGLFFLTAASIFISQFWGAPWVVTPLENVRAMLSLAEVQPGEKVIDLGAGDGRIVIAAVRDFQAEAVGVEIDPIRYLLANLFIKRFGVFPQARIHYGDLRSFDISDADVVTVYLTRKSNQKLEPLLQERLKPGARVVSHAFPFSGWTPSIIDEHHLIFLYEIDNMGSEVETKFV